MPEPIPAELIPAEHVPAEHVPVEVPKEAASAKTEPLLDRIERESTEAFAKMKADAAPPEKLLDKPLAAAAQTPGVAAADSGADSGDEEPPETIKSPKARADWKRIKEARDTALHEKKDLEARLKVLEQDTQKFKQNAVPPEELNKLKVERDDLDSRLKRLDLERHPQFQKHFTEKIDGAMAQAKKLVGTENSSRIEALLRMPDSEWKTAQLDEIMEALPRSKGSQLGALLNQLEQVQVERQKELDNWQVNLQAAGKVAEAKQQEQLGEISEAFERVAKSLGNGDQGLPAYRLREGDSEWNSAVQKRLDAARQLYLGNVPMQQRAQAALLAAVMPDLAQEAVAVAKERDQLKEELSALKKGKPAPSAESGATPLSAEDDNLSVVDRIVKAAQNAGAFNQ